MGGSLIKEVRGKIDELKRTRATISDGIATEKDLLKSSVQRRDDLIAALDIARSVAEALQRDVHERIAGLVTRCLSAVFGEDAYEFRILTEQKRGRTEARAVFVRDEEEFDALSSIGGGVVDVAAFALRIAVLLARHDSRRVFVADEPFRFVSAHYRPQVRYLLEKLSEELDVQFIIVTHIEEFEMGEIINITKS